MVYQFSMPLNDANAHNSKCCVWRAFQLRCLPCGAAVLSESERIRDESGDVNTDCASIIVVNKENFRSWSLYLVDRKVEWHPIALITSLSSLEENSALIIFEGLWFGLSVIIYYTTLSAWVAMAV